MAYLKNCWYQAGWASELVGAAPLARTLLDEPVVIWRDLQGRLMALYDRCPHRFAPLSAGKVTSDGVSCGYHGLTFNGDGACVRNPHGPLSRAFRVRAYPVEERHGIIWIWFGDRPSNPDFIPDLAFIDDTPAVARIQASFPTKANYELIVDNIMDLTHIDYIHPETLGRMMSTADASFEVRDESVVASWRAQNAETPIAYKAMVPNGRSDIHATVSWSAPAMIVLDNAVTPTGIAPAAGDHRLTLHNMTPETATTTHYFMCSTRRFATDDQQVTEQLRSALMRAFGDEDKPMLELQQERIGNADFLSLSPALMKIDTASMQARRLLSSLIAAEAQ